MSPALNGSSAIRRFEGSDAIEKRNGVTFDFYTGLPHMRILISDYLEGEKGVWEISSHAVHDVTPHELTVDSNSEFLLCFLQIKERGMHGACTFRPTN